MPYVHANDGTRLHVTEHGEGRPLVLLHGWPFSGRLFDRNVADLARHSRVVVVDLRGFGDSDKPRHGYRIGRLAQDLRDVLVALDLRDVTVLGWSMGCAVIWSYLELFGPDRLAAAVYVQQSPRQYAGPDWQLGHGTTVDDTALAALVAEVEADPAAFDRAQLPKVLASEPTTAERELFLAEMAKSPPYARNAVMTDHTRQDWRDLLPTLRLPTLVLAAGQDEAFTAEAVAWVGEAVPGARTEVFEASSHALFFDEPARFDDVVRAFLDGLPG